MVVLFPFRCAELRCFNRARQGRRRPPILVRFHSAARNCGVSTPGIRISSPGLFNGFHSAARNCGVSTKIEGDSDVDAFLSFHSAARNCGVSTDEAIHRITSLESSFHSAARNCGVSTKSTVKPSGSSHTVSIPLRGIAVFQRCI